MVINIQLHRQDKNTGDRYRSPVPKNKYKERIKRRQKEAQELAQQHGQSNQMSWLLQRS